MLNLPVHRPPRPDPLLRYFEQHPYAKNRSARTVTTYLIAVGRPTPSAPPRHQPGGATRADLEAFLADPLARRHVRDGWAGAALRKVTAAPIPNELVAVLLPS